MEILNNVCKAKIDKIVETVMETQHKQNNGNSNTAHTSHKFISFILIMDQVIQSSLSLQYK